MIEIAIVLAFFGYIYYLKNYADLRSKSDKEEESLEEGIRMLKNNQVQEAFYYFDRRISLKKNSPVAYLYRSRCYKEMGDWNAAMKDVETGISYDESVFGLHLDRGKLLYAKEMYDEALKSLSKAIFNAGERDPESYYWRGMTKQKLLLEDEAQKDFDKEREITELQIRSAQGTLLPVKPLFDKRLLVNSGLVICTSVLMLFIIKNATSIHLPYLIATLTAICIGFVEPHKGWILAIMQCIFILGGYYLFTEIPANGGKKELEYFCLYGSAILTFMGSFLGAFLKRAINNA